MSNKVLRKYIAIERIKEIREKVKKELKILNSFLVVLRFQNKGSQIQFNNEEMSVNFKFCSIILVLPVNSWQLTKVLLLAHKKKYKMHNKVIYEDRVWYNNGFEEYHLLVCDII